jgi:hypothetical protein
LEVDVIVHYKGHCLGFLVLVVYKDLLQFLWTVEFLCDAEEALL